MERKITWKTPDDKLTPKEYKERYSGMKKAPKINVEYRKDLTVKADKAKKLIIARKVRPSESLESWQRRMKRFNLMTEKQIQNILNTKKYKYRVIQHKRKNQQKHIEHFNLWKKISFDKKVYDFMSYSGIVKTYFCIKHAIRKDDFDIALAFYNNVLITEERFNNICILNTGTANGVLRRFKQKNYVIEAIKDVKREKLGITTQNKTGIYKLSRELSFIIYHFYILIVKFDTLKSKEYKGLYPKEVEKEILAMNSEIQDYLTLNKNQEIL